MFIETIDQKERLWAKKKDYEPGFELDTISVNSQDAYPLDYACYVDIGLNFK